MNLVEQYSKRVQVAEAVYGKAHEGAKLDNSKKLTIATCLNNVEKFMTEAFNASMGTQRSAMGDFKKFCINLTNIALPNLIATDLVITKPMTSITGYVTYLQYTAGVTKGETSEGHMLNNPFKLGNYDSNYTSEKVVEAATAGTGAQALAWTVNGDIAHGVFHVVTWTEGGVTKTAIKEELGIKFDTLPNPTVTNYDVKLVKANTADIYGFYKAADKKFYSDAACTTQITVAADTKVAYVYDNVIVPQETLPTLKAEMKGITLFAKARRLAVYYSQIAAFQAQQDYGINLGDDLAEQAVGELAYEIDQEVVQLLDATAGTEQTALTWSKTLPVGVNKKDHYQGFSEIVSIGNQLVYDRTKRFMPTYMVCASDIIPVLNMVDGFKAASTANINGPYLAGNFNGLKVYVSPAMAAGRYVLGVNGGDEKTSVAIYAPYMPIVPTMLLQQADGQTSQGFSTMYDLKVLNPDLIVAGKVTA